MKMNYRLLFPLFLLVSCPSLRVVAMDETQELVLAADGYVNRDFDENILREMGFKEIQIKAMNPYYYHAMASLEQQPVEATTWAKDPEFEASKAHPRAKWNQIPVADVVTKLEQSLKLGSITESTADAAKAELHELNSARAVIDAQGARKDLHMLAAFTASQAAKNHQSARIAQPALAKAFHTKIGLLDQDYSKRTKAWALENEQLDLALKIRSDKEKIDSLTKKIQEAKPKAEQPAPKSVLASILSLFWRS